MKPASLLGLAGRAGAGKDTVAVLLEDCIWGERGGEGIVRRSFAAPIKAAVETFVGVPAFMAREEKEKPVEWLGETRNGEKITPRLLWQTFGTEWARQVLGDDIFVKILERHLRASASAREHWIITDVRYPNEIAFIRRHGGAVWWVERDGLPPVRAHASEGAIGPQDCDGTIANFGTVDNLAVTVELAWNRWRAERAAA